MADKHPRLKHATESTRSALHAIEHSAADVYHTVEDHDARELRQDVKGVLDHLADWFKPRTQAFKHWYLAQPPLLQIVYGLTLLPVVVLVTFAVFLLIKFGGPVLLTLALLLKLSISLIKMLLFIGYIGYKIIKTLLMWYFTIARLYLGNKAKRRRFAQAQACSFTVVPASAAGELSFRCRRKDLYISHAEYGQIRVLFSYLRYALLGQRELLQHFRRSWKHYFMLWRQSSRETINAELAPVGASLFNPHTLGAQTNTERVLVPGDAELIQIELKPGHTLLTFSIRWVEWQFGLRRALKFLQIKRHPRQASWHVGAAFGASPEAFAKSLGVS